MTRKENLIALRDGLVADECSEELIFALWPNDAPDRLLAYVVDEAAQGDMNAALAFLAEVLPAGTTWQYYSGDGHCIVGYGPGLTDYDEAHHDTPARALLIAALNALIEETDE